MTNSSEPREPEARKNIDSTAIKEKKSPWWIIVGIGIGVGLFLHGLSFYINDKAMSAANQALSFYISENQQPRVATLDIEKTIERFKAQSNDDFIALRGIAVLISLLQMDGYMVIDSKSVLAVPDKYVIKDFTLEELERVAVRRGIDLEAEMDKLVNQAVKDAEARTREIQEMIRQLERESAF